MKFVMIVLGLLCLGLMVLIGRGCQRANTPEGRQKAAEREAIARCVKMRDDELQELSTRRLVREVCVRMDREFEAKWGIPSREL